MTEVEDFVAAPGFRLAAMATAAATGTAAPVGRVRIGVSGWRYAPWRGAFYPEGLVQRRELEFAARAFSSLEINGSFYSLQRPQSWRAWADETPDDFVFAVKGSRFITHMLRLREIEIPLANFFASGVLQLGAKLGPLLWQFPPNFGFEPAAFAAFLQLLPRTTGQARALASRHDARLAGRAWFEPVDERPLRHAVEVRHPSFAVPAFIELLRAQNIAFVNADTAGKWPEYDDITADFLYLRLHGSTTLYQSAYSDAELDTWAARIDSGRRGKVVAGARRIAPSLRPARGPHDVYCYFDNTDKLEAPRDARRLQERITATA